MARSHFPAARVALIACGLVTAGFTGMASAQAVRQYGTTDAVDPAEVAQILGADPTAPVRVAKMRALRILDPSTAPMGSTARATPTGENAPAPTHRPSALALLVQFDFDSANILPQARPQLDALAAGIKMLVGGRRVVIEGHTDSVGTELYNLQLSERRAQTVKDYLVRVEGIDADRLATVGFGPFRPINSADGRAGENRRVQFHGE
jgi:outer membrane protein OmpA-like peptidoglycan-associated protein